MYHRLPSITTSINKNITHNTHLSLNKKMSSYCPICDQFVDNLDNCELPYGGAPSPDGAPSDRSEPDYDDEYYDYDRWPMRRPWYYVPEVPLVEVEERPVTRSKTVKDRTSELSTNVKIILNKLKSVTGIENRLVFIDKIYALMKNLSILMYNFALKNI